MVNELLIDEICKAGGHDEPLSRFMNVKMEGEIRVRELDLENERVLDFILYDIKREFQAGTLISSTSYKGKRVKSWFSHSFPPILNPKILGLFKDNVLMGWISFLDSISFKGRKILGFIIYKEFRNKGLGSTVLMHCWKFKSALFDNNTFEYSFRTKRSNIPMNSIARKLGMVEIEIPKEVLNSNKYIDFILDDNP